MSYAGGPPAGASRPQGNRPTLFHDAENDVPIRFYLQKYLSESLAEILRDVITSNGGAIIDKVPLRGYVLIDPLSSKGMKIKRMWDDADKPHRYIVTYTFVAACVASRQLLDHSEFKDAVPIFTYEGKPVTFQFENHLEGSIQRALTQAIIKSGGVLAKTHEKPRVVIVDPATSYHRKLIREFDHDSETYVESPQWVEDCIAENKYEHILETRAVGGRKPGSSRTAYTTDDDQNLVEYMGCRLPYRTMGGRTGNEIFKELCERVDLYPWASRHTWLSWRNRYKTNKKRLDDDIDEWVLSNPPAPDGKGQYRIKRNKHSDRILEKEAVKSEEDAHDESMPPHKKARTDDGPVVQQARQEDGGRIGQAPTVAVNGSGEGPTVSESTTGRKTAKGRRTAEDLMKMHLHR